MSYIEFGNLGFKNVNETTDISPFVYTAFPHEAFGGWEYVVGLFLGFYVPVMSRSRDYDCFSRHTTLMVSFSNYYIYFDKRFTGGALEWISLSFKVLLDSFSVYRIFSVCMADRETNIINGWLLQYKTKSISGAPKVSSNRSWLDSFDPLGSPVVGLGTDLDITRLVIQIIQLCAALYNIIVLSQSNLYYWSFAYNTSYFFASLFCMIDHVTGGRTIYPMAAHKRYRLGDGEYNF